MKKRLFIVCAGLDSVSRGFESFARKLFSALIQDHPSEWEIVLIKRDGAKLDNEWVTQTPGRNSWLCKLLAKIRATPYHWEGVIFSLRALLLIRKKVGEKTVIFSVEPSVERSFFHLKKWLPKNSELLFSHSVWLEPQHYVPYAERIQEVNIENFARSYEYLNEKSKVSLIPFFETVPPYLKKHSKVDLKAKFKINTPFAALCVGVIDRSHKRTHYILEECQKLPSDWSLILCGKLSDKSILALDQTLGSRLIHLHLPRDQMPMVYTCADLFIHAATTEGFGMVFLEAMKHKLPILSHQNELFSWIIKDPDQSIDMNMKSGLQNKLSQVCSDEAWRQNKAEFNFENLNQNFSWNALKQDYARFLFGDSL